MYSVKPFWVRLVASIASVFVITAAAALADRPANDPATTTSLTFGLDTKEGSGSVASGAPIGSSEAGADDKLVYSMKIPNANQNARINIAASVSLTKCEESDVNQGSLHTPCKLNRSGGHTYGYAPYVKARLIRTSSNTSTTPSSGGILKTDTRSCGANAHHCPINLDGASLSYDSSHSLPGSGDYLNVIVKAWAPSGASPQNGDVVEIEGDCQGGDYDPCTPTPEDDANEQLATQYFDGETKGQLTAVRRGTSYTGRTTISDQTLDPGGSQIQIDTGGAPAQPAREAVYSIPVKHLYSGDVVEVSGDVDLTDNNANNPANYHFDHDAVTMWLLGSSDDVQVSPSSDDRALSANNGWNCYTGSCTRGQSGMTVVGNGVNDKTLYVNFLVFAKDENDSGNQPKYLTVKANSFSVSCYAAPTSPAHSCDPQEKD